MKPTRLDDQTFERLAGASGERLISIAIPTHVRGREISQDRIQLKNQLAELDSTLEAAGVKSRQRASQLEAATALLDDVEFWEHQSEQLVLYVDDKGDILPIAVTRRSRHLPTVISTVYHLRHVLPDLHPVRLPVLVLTENAVKLYSATETDIDELEADLPSSLDDVNWFVDRETQRQQHPDRAGTSRNRHGHEASAGADEDTARFLRAVRDALPADFHGVPLVVLGDDNLVSRFKSISEEPILSPENSGVDDLSASAIHEMARPELERHRADMNSALSSEALDQLGVGNATTELAAALGDAVSGRISRVVLFADTKPAWGRVDPTSMQAETTDRPGLGDVDLIDRLIAESLATGADVVLTDAPSGDHDLVAVRRF
ncbi:MAG: hypothetical protein WEF28_05525 [Acidimicrobiia bacterium]